MVLKKVYLWYTCLGLLDFHFLYWVFGEKGSFCVHVPGYSAVFSSPADLTSSLQRSALQHLASSGRHCSIRPPAVCVCNLHFRSDFVCVGFTPGSLVSSHIPRTRGRVKRYLCISHSIWMCLNVTQASILFRLSPFLCPLFPGTASRLMGIRYQIGNKENYGYLLELQNANSPLYYLTLSSYPFADVPIRHLWTCCLSMTSHPVTSLACINSSEGLPFHATPLWHAMQCFPYFSLN